MPQSSSARDAPPPPPSAADDVAAAVREELDQVLPHVVHALKRQDAVGALTERLDRAERRLAERQQRPLIAGVRRALATARQLDYDPDAKRAIVSELEGVLAGGGYAEFGAPGQRFDPARHEVVAGSVDGGEAIVVELFEPGLQTLGEIVVPARVRVGAPDQQPHREDERA